MKDYVRGNICRRLVILRPFLETSQSVQPGHDCCDVCSLNCCCLCTCTSICTCEKPCQGSESPILTSIISSLISQADEDGSDSSDCDDVKFSSGSDIEECLRRKPKVIDSTEEND